ncbi:hypothetical protein I553_9774 [Mycobacterium xenopi 4042]|uniref:Uncharacterized protein n=1 Tax=Mycobacterium xenopi 4042 TaxID=1299334 RepID=X7YNC9_MYCXE|nr:hypothetical protein I553_9774 [Mycobacterium xenopi 4042]
MEVDAGFRDSGAGPRHPGIGLAGITILVAAIAFGAYLLVTGIAQVIFAFSLHVSAGGRVLLFISGAASLVLAVLAFRHFGNDPLIAILLLAIWIGVGFIFRGVQRRSRRSATPTCLGEAGRSSSVWSACLPAS